MQVVSVKDTGHLVGSVSPNYDSSPSTSSDDLLGESVPLVADTMDKTPVLFDSNYLEVHQVAFDLGVLFRPGSFGYDPGAQMVNELVAPAPVTAKPTLSATGVSVVFSAALTASTKCFCVLRRDSPTTPGGTPEHFFLSLDLDATTLKSASATQGLATGAHFFGVLLVKNFLPYWFDATV
jgi:hypothetical protein